MTFDGKVLRVWKPDHGIDDTTSEILNGDLAFWRMLTEVANMNRVDAGTPVCSLALLESVRRCFLAL